MLCLYLVNKYFIFSILYILYKSLMAGRGSGFRRGKGRPRKHGLPSHTRGPSITFIVPTSTTPTTAAAFSPPAHFPHTQEFVIIPNPEHVESGH